MSMVRENYLKICEGLKAALGKDGRQGEPFTLIVASKYAGLHQIEELIQAGQKDFGESRVQDAEKKITYFSSKYPDLRWHMIGHLQANKVRKAVSLFHSLQTIDSEKILLRAESSASETGKILPVMIQVNIACDTHKSGAGSKDVLSLVEKSLMCGHLECVGLMTLPPYFKDPEKSRPYFSQMRQLQKDINQAMGRNLIQQLSMGMSNDYLVAIEEGATTVRIGSAIFEE